MSSISFWNVEQSLHSLASLFLECVWQGNLGKGMLVFEVLFHANSDGLGSLSAQLKALFTWAKVHWSYSTRNCSWPKMLQVDTFWHPLSTWLGVHWSMMQPLQKAVQGKSTVWGPTFVVHLWAGTHIKIINILLMKYIKRKISCNDFCSIYFERKCHCDCAGHILLWHANPAISKMVEKCVSGNPDWLYSLEMDNWLCWTFFKNEVKG